MVISVKNMGVCSDPNTKYDWYQTSAEIILNILVKQIKPENVRVDLHESNLLCKAKLADDAEFSLSLNLAHPVLASQMRWKVFPSKIEIKLKKTEAVMWQKLENILEDKKGATSQQYPSSNSQKRDWDKIAHDIKKEEAEEKLDGEAALNQLFQKIYSDGSDETKKAMNKSFMESGGTVLSTSWNEVGSKKVEVKPPEGAEYKQWDQ